MLNSNLNTNVIKIKILKLYYNWLKNFRKILNYVKPEPLDIQLEQYFGSDFNSNNVRFTFSSKYNNFIKELLHCKNYAQPLAITSKRYMNLSSPDYSSPRLFIVNYSHQGLSIAGWIVWKWKVLLMKVPEVNSPWYDHMNEKSGDGKF